MEHTAQALLANDRREKYWSDGPSLLFLFKMLTGTQKYDLGVKIILMISYFLI